MVLTWGKVRGIAQPGRASALGAYNLLPTYNLRSPLNKRFLIKYDLQMKDNCLIYPFNTFKKLSTEGLL